MVIACPLIVWWWGWWGKQAKKQPLNPLSGEVLLGFG